MADPWTTPKCEECDDRGWIVSRDGGAGAARPCSCRERVTIEERMAKAGVPAAYQRCSFATFDPTINGPLPEQLVAYAANPAGFLLLIGDPGRGKSHAAAAVLRATLDAGRHGLWCDAPGFIDDLKATQDWDAAHAAVDRLKSVELPVLDDLGAELETEWSRDTLSRVVRYRHATEGPLVATTNKSMRELQTWAPAVASRLAFGLVVKLDGKDYRLRRVAR